MKYTCNSLGCMKMGVVYETEDLPGGQVPLCSLCMERCAQVNDIEPEPEPDLEPQLDQATAGVDQYESPSQALTALAHFYGRHYGECFSEAVRMLRADAALLVE